MPSPPIQPRTLKGFRDYLPPAMLAREAIMDTARRVFRSYGFSPIDTPALEYLEILLGKGGAETDKQLYRFQDHGGRDVGLRFDLTVPLARFAAQHIGELGTPFKRYHIATGVARREHAARPLPRVHAVRLRHDRHQERRRRCRNRSRRPRLAPRDRLRAIYDPRQQSPRPHTACSNRSACNRPRPMSSAASTSSRKIGPEKVVEEICQTAGASADQAQRIVSMVQVSGTNEAILDQLRPLVGSSDAASKASIASRELWNAVRAAGIPEHRVKIDVSIARGLDYYTGTVLETTLDDKPEMGSVCSGGRYDNLAELYTKQELPGIGASLGLDRLLAAMEELEMLPARQTPAEVFIPYFDAAHLGEYFQLAGVLRAAGFGVEVFCEPTKLGKQLQYADRKGFRVAIIAGEREFAAGNCQVKNLATTESTTVSLADNAAELVREVTRLLAGIAM